MDKNEYIKKFKRCINEWTSLPNSVSEEGEDDLMGGDPNAMGGGPNAMGGDPNAMGGDPNAMGGGPDAMGGDPNAMGGDPNAMSDGSNGQAPQGFAPQGEDNSLSMDGMGGDPNAIGGGQSEGNDEEVIDVDDLTNSQEDTEKKVDALTSKFEKVMNSLNDIEKRINAIDAHTNEYITTLKSEMEKRNPTPQQRLTMRSTKSAPYGMSPNEYMNNYAPDNYSDADDNNGADDPQYKITKGDIDSFTDYSSIANELNGKMGIKDILGY